VLLAAITRLFARHHGRYGSPRIHHLLVATHGVVSRRRVARLMQTAGLRAKAVRGYRGKVGTHRFYEQHPNRVRTATVDRPNQVWVGDITYLAVAGEWRYLAVVMDRFSRRILAWTLRRRREARVTRAVLQTAARHRRPPPGLTFHSFKAEVVRGVSFPTDAALRHTLCHFFRYYNHTRLHSALGFQSPVDYEARTA
jgi:transposase InsO family protein